MSGIVEKIRDKAYLGEEKNKKILLSVISTATLLNDGEEFLDKLKRNLEVYGANKNKIVLVFCVQPGIEDELKLLNKDLIEPFRAVLRLYEERDFCVAIEYDELDEVYDICDAYYGDWSVAAWRCRNMKKPVMILNSGVE